MHIQSIPAPRNLVQQLAALRAGDCQLNAIPRNAQASIARVTGVIAHGERVVSLALVKRMGENGICGTSARSAMAVAVKYGVLATEGTGRDRTYWLTEQGH